MLDVLLVEDDASKWHALQTRTNEGEKKHEGKERRNEERRDGELCVCVCVCVCLCVLAEN